MSVASPGEPVTCRSESRTRNAPAKVPPAASSVPTNGVSIPASTRPRLTSRPVMPRASPAPLAVLMTAPEALSKPSGPQSRRELSSDQPLLELASRRIVPRFSASASAVSFATPQVVVPSTHNVPTVERLDTSLLPAPTSRRVEAAARPSPTNTVELRARTVPSSTPPSKSKPPLSKKKAPWASILPAVCTNTGAAPRTSRVVPASMRIEPSFIRLPSMERPSP